jgi:hypothetical protein
MPSRPRFKREELIVAEEAVEVYYRDVNECIRALYGDPKFASVLKVVPERHYVQWNGGEEQAYHEMYTGKWWWKTQVSEILFHSS